jgi:hypothetical protein
MLFNFRPWEEYTNNEPQLPRLPLVCWAVRNGHAALLKVIDNNNSIPLSDYLESTAAWFGSKNQQFLSGKTNCIKELSTILLPDLQEMIDSPTSAALFFFISEACARGDVVIMEQVISILEQSLKWQPEQSIINLEAILRELQLIVEYFMIEAAANAQDKICYLLTPYTKFQAVTM